LDYGLDSSYGEISLITHKNYRGMGVGTYITSHMINKCLELNLKPIWSCQANNRPSLKTAFKVGSEFSNYYIQMVPNIGNSLNPALEKWIIENSPLD
jgi:predicted acetyltransferase